MLCLLVLRHCHRDKLEFFTKGGFLVHRRHRKRVTRGESLPPRIKVRED